MNWTKEEENQAKEEYLHMLSALQNSEEFSHEWSGKWDDSEKEIFGGRKRLIKGDKHKYIKYWIENQSIINDQNWNKINENEDEYI